MDGMTCCGPGYASPMEAMKAPREELLIYNSYLCWYWHSSSRLSCHN